MRSRGLAAPSPTQLGSAPLQCHVQRVWRQTGQQGTGHCATLVDAAVKLAHQVVEGQHSSGGRPALPNPQALAEVVTSTAQHSHVEQELIAAVAVLLPLVVSQQLMLSEVEAQLPSVAHTLQDATALMQAALDPAQLARGLSHSCEGSAGWPPLAVASAITWCTLALSQQPGNAAASHRILPALAKLNQSHPLRKGHATKTSSSHSSSSSRGVQPAGLGQSQTAQSWPSLQQHSHAPPQQPSSSHSWGMLPSARPRHLPRVMCMSVSPSRTQEQQHTGHDTALQEPTTSDHSTAQATSSAAQGSPAPELPPSSLPAAVIKPSGSMYVTEVDDSDSPGIPMLNPRAPLRQPLERPQRPSVRPQSVPPSSQPDSTSGQDSSGLSSTPSPASLASPSPGVVGNTLDGSTYTMSSESDDDDSWGVSISRQQAQYIPKRLRVARALPLNLVPATPTSCLLDPITQEPITPRYTNTGSSNHQSHQQPDASSSTTQQQQHVSLPLLGPWILTTDTSAFPACDALVSQPKSQQGRAVQDRLAIRLEYVANREQDDEFAAWQQGMQLEQGLEGLIDNPPVATLQLFNISRRRRGHVGNVQVFVERPAPGQDGTHTGTSQQLVIRPGDRGLELQPGDVIVLGVAPDAPRFRVESQHHTPTTAAIINTAVKCYCHPPRTSRTLGTRRLPAAVASAVAAIESGQALSLQQLAQVARVGQGTLGVADTGYRLTVGGPERGNPFAWIAWAQLSARRGRLIKARNLFRVAAVVAAASKPGYYTDDDDDFQQDAMGATEPLPQGEQQQQQQVVDQGLVQVIRSNRSSVGLVQSLFTWGRFEWNVSKVRGAARHLWRTAADVAMLHDNGPEAGGLNIVLHNWVTSELECNNVHNARVVVAEALRKCPTDTALFVAAAQVELKGGNPELAREFCLRAYQLDRVDKHLYYVWPLVMAKLGEKEKARVLFERGLDYHPTNIKIMDSYARFETEVGDLDKALELHERALEVDSTSWASMSNRTSWAEVEMQCGDFRTAFELLQEGLRVHPTHLGARLAMAKLHRLAGNWPAAQQEVRIASQLTNAFNTDLLHERAALMRALGEHALAAAIEAHLGTVRAWLKAKQQGLNTGEAWQLYQQLSSTPERQRIARQAFARKQELGWLSAPGVPGPRGARRGVGGRQEVAWMPLPGPAPPAPPAPDSQVSMHGPAATTSGDPGGDEHGVVSAAHNAGLQQEQQQGAAPPQGAGQWAQQAEHPDPQQAVFVALSDGEEVGMDAPRRGNGSGSGSGRAEMRSQDLRLGRLDSSTGVGYGSGASGQQQQAEDGEDEDGDEGGAVQQEARTPLLASTMTSDPARDRRH